MKIAIIQIILGNYDIFWDDFYSSSEYYFCPRDSKDYFVFTDSSHIVNKDNVLLFYQDYLGWPFSTLFRYHMISRISDRIKDYDAIVFFNSNTIFVNEINFREFFGSPSSELVAGIHPSFPIGTSNKYPVEKRLQSECSLSGALFYVQGCINGGKAKPFIDSVFKMRQMIDKDLSNGILAKWHDESYWNYIVNMKHLKDSNTINLLNHNYLVPTIYRRNKVYKYAKVYMRSKELFGGHSYFRNDSNNFTGRLYSYLCKLYYKMSFRF